MDAYPWQELLRSPLTLALIAVAIERFVPWPEHWHPVAIFRLFAQFLQNKVNKAHYSASQQRLAGSLALMLLLVLVLAPTAIVVYAADFSDILGALVLLASLRQRHHRIILNNVERFARKGQKRAARALLARVDSRDCDRLSLHGLAKTTLELQAMSVVHHRYAPILGWFVGGPILALALRLIVEMNELWPISQRRYQHFGLATRAAYAMSVGLVSLLLAAVAWLLATVRGRRRSEPLQSSRAWLATTASWLANLSRLHNVSLGGPILQQGQRIERQRFAGRPAEQVWSGVSRALTIWQLSIAVSLLIIILMMFIYRP